MVILLLILLAFAALRFLVVLTNLVTLQWLRPHEVAGNPKISVLIPARNEEKNIGALLKELADIPDGLPPAPRYISEIIVYDDQSTDETVAAVNSVQDAHGLIKLIRGKELPDGWLGKNYACHRLSEEAKGDWLLFLDADVMITPDLIRDAVGYAQKKQLRLLSLFPQQVMKTPGEWLVVPLMNWILVSLLPLILVRKCRWTSFAAANGQFMLFDATIYQRFQWHAQVMAHPVEDILISRLMKKRHFRTATILSAGQIQCRMYEGYSQAVNGFSKNVGQFFGNSLPWMLTFLLLTTILPIPTLLLTLLTPHSSLSLHSFLSLHSSHSLLSSPSLLSSSSSLSLLYVFLLLFIRLGFSILSRQNVLKNLLFWIPQQFVLIVLVIKSIRFRTGRKVEWKGRKV